MADNWTSSAARDPQVITNENVVIVVLTLVGEARKTGERIEMPLVHVLKVRNGR